MAVIEEIGVIRSKFSESTDPFLMRKEISTIEVHDAYADGLYDIESNEYLQILFIFTAAASIACRADGTSEIQRVYSHREVRNDPGR